MKSFCRKTSKPTGRYTCIWKDNIKIDLKIYKRSGIWFTWSRIWKINSPLNRTTVSKRRWNFWVAKQPSASLRQTLLHEDYLVSEREVSKYSARHCRLKHPTKDAEDIFALRNPRVQKDFTSNTSDGTEKMIAICSWWCIFPQRLKE